MNTELARRHMVDRQIRTRDVLDERVLALFEHLPRDEFVPPAYRRLAFADCEIPLGHGQYMMIPSIEARLIQALALKPHHTVLEVGAGSGYLTACLAGLAANVTSIEIHPEFASEAADRLAERDITNASISVMDACRELPQGPFDAIAVTGSLPVLDQRYLDLLKPGGRLFVVTGHAPVMDALRIVRVSDTDWRTTSLFETSLGRLVHAREPAGFTF